MILQKNYQLSCWTNFPQSDVSFKYQNQTKNIVNMLEKAQYAGMHNINSHTTAQRCHSKLCPRAQAQMTCICLGSNC